MVYEGYATLTAVFAVAVTISSIGLVASVASLCARKFPRWHKPFVEVAPRAEIS
jgi:hypothetical protein